MAAQTKEQKDQVLVAQADYLFAHGEHDLAAAKYARTTRSFEEVALKFINIENRPALKTFLMLKLSTLPATVRLRRWWVVPQHGWRLLTRRVRVCLAGLHPAHNLVHVADGDILGRDDVAARLGRRHGDASAVCRHASC